MTEFNTGLPSVRLVQQWIKDKKVITVKLSTGETLEGGVLWQDPQCLYLRQETQGEILIWRQAVVFLEPKA